MSIRELFDFITDITIPYDDVDNHLQMMYEVISKRTTSAQDTVDDGVFKNIHIPRTLAEVVHIERDVDRFAKGDLEEIYYDKITGLNDIATYEKQPDEGNTSHERMEKIDRKTSDSTTFECIEQEKPIDNDTQKSSNIEPQEQLNADGTILNARDSNDSSLTKQERKKLVKTIQRENRKNKVPKHVKKRKKKLAHTK